jgi:RNA polymerase sigma factor (sigma-70 family)
VTVQAALTQSNPLPHRQVIQIFLEISAIFWEAKLWSVFSTLKPTVRKQHRNPVVAPNQITELLAKLLDLHAAALELYASQWTATPTDCVQEAFIALASLLKQSDTPLEHLTAWLYRTVRNQALNAARAHRRRQHHEQIAARLTECKHENQLAMTEHLPLLEAIDALPTTERELIVLRIWSGLTWQEIAELTKTSSSSAQRRYVAALAKIRQHLEPSCPPNPI